MSTQAPARFSLLDGYDFPRLINGAWQLSSGHSGRTLDQERVLQELEELVRAGLSAFDCADIYSGVEELLGELRRRLRPTGLSLQVHTKFVPDRSALKSVNKRYVEHIINRSLQRLGTERLDLVQYHWWDFSIPGWIETALWLDELRREGKIARIGMTNTDVIHLAEILDAGVPVATNQVQYSLLDRRPEHGLTDFCREQGIQLLCYGTLAGGFLSQRYLGVPKPTGALPNRSLTKYGLIIEEAGGWNAFQSLLALLDRIARRHDSTIANVATRWVLDQSAVAAAIIGTTGNRHLENNLRTFALQLDREDREQIAAALASRPGPLGDAYSLERDWESAHARIMWTDLNEQSDAGDSGGPEV
jgi:aryl-alcohol dehydrogenase-like predicted oxidoreductase